MDETWKGFLHDLEAVRSVAPRLAPAELRNDGDDEPSRLTGHFSVFNSWYEINSFFEGRFLERVSPGAFARTFNAANAASDPHRIQVLLEHGHDRSVGDKPLGVPEELREDGTGAFYVARLFDSSYVRDLMPAFESGVYGSSFRFRVIQDEWNDEPGVSEHNPEGIPERTIREMRVFEFGPTLFPASPTATAGLRSDTDRFYEELRSREPNHYQELLSRAREIRTPTDGPARKGTPTDGPATQPADPPTGTRRTPEREQLLAQINAWKGTRR